jgi:hypothetical protein
MAFLLMSGGLLSCSAVELVFRYRKSVEGLRAVQQEIAQRAAVSVQVSHGGVAATPDGDAHP